jgi:hypothetical protein
MIQTIVLYWFVAAGLAGSLALFWGVKREIHAQARRNSKRMDQLSRALDAPAKEPEPVYLPAVTLRSGLNVSTRVQAMRMVRRNEDVSHIAAALGVTRREVELLIRVHSMKPGI